MTERTGQAEMEPARFFRDPEALQLTQLRQLEWMEAPGRRRTGDDEKTPACTPEEIPERWELAKGVEAYQWQVECVAKWKKKGKGTVKVVTGGGKTLLAFLIGQWLQNEEDGELRIAIIVPTIVLMHQWYDALLEHGNLSPEAIGRLGGGYDDDFADDRRVLIAVLASASQRLPKLVRTADVGEHLFLVADECHRAGAAEMSNVFKTKRRWSLGLSATPEREDDEDKGYNKSLLGRKLGPIIYEFTLADALREGLVPKYTINHFGLQMTAEERQRYDSLSRSITDAMSQLRAQRDARSDGDFFSWARAVASRNEGDVGAIARRFVSDTSKRRELLNHMEARREAVIQLIDREFEINPEARIILFHESIEEVERLFKHLWRRGLPAIAEHSELPGSLREEALERFRKGKAQIIVSARSLIEGFNVPAADVGIIVASTTSVRQRIQSLGRVLRRHRGPSGEEKTSCVHVLYAADSSEENIYGKLDWDVVTGADQNNFYVWDDLKNEPRVQEGPPRRPLPTEMLIDADALRVGEKYPGEYEGTELTCDTQGNVTDADGQYATETGALAEAILKVKGSAGRFRVTEKRRFVLVRVPCGEEWETLFVTRLGKPLKFGRRHGSESVAEAKTWAANAQTGDSYPFSGLKIIDDGLRFKQKSGGVISRKVKGGEVFARVGERAENPGKGADVARLMAAVKKLHQAGKRVSRIEINEASHVTYREGGQTYFVCGLDNGLEFPEHEPA